MEPLRFIDRGIRRLCSRGSKMIVAITLLDAAMYVVLPDRRCNGSHRTGMGDEFRIRIPKAIARQAGLRKGTRIQIEAVGGVLKIRRVRRRRSKGPSAVSTKR
jgi:hypothetical protein